MFVTLMAHPFISGMFDAYPACAHNYPRYTHIIQVYCVCVYVGPIGSFYFCASGVFEAMLEALRRLSPEKCSDVPSLKLGCNGCNGCKKHREMWAGPNLMIFNNTK